MTQPDAARVERGPITEVKHFALGMADLLERQGFTVAAAELRRLHAENEALQNTKHYEAPRGFVLNPDYLVPELRAQRDALLEALKEIAADYADRFDLDCPSTNPGIKSTIKQARAAIAKAEENT